MFLDPLNGKIIFSPETLKKVDPLLVQLYYHPETLTPEQTAEAHLRAMSGFCDFLPLDELKKLEAAAAKPIKPPRRKQSAYPAEPALADMISGKIALREMGLVEQTNPQLYATADLLDRERKRAARKKKRQPADTKSLAKKNSPKKKADTKLPRKRGA